MMTRQNVQPSAPLICLAAWLLAALTQLVFVLTLPSDKALAFGVDIAHATHLVLLNQALYVTCGLALAVGACVIRQWRFSLVIVSSLFYLFHWFPWRMVGSYGVIATAKSMY